MKTSERQAATVQTAVAPLRLAIVGAGAVTERLHLPALASSSVVKVTALVDPNPSRRELLGGLFPGLHLAGDLEGIERHADFALVAVPHHLHRDISTRLLERGLHVLVEKPLATSLEDADAIISAAARSGRMMSVGLIRRQYPSFEFVRQVVERGLLGELRSFDWREGGVYGWPVASPALFKRDAGGGVLFDTGAHSLDTLLAWLGPFDSVEYQDDGHGGVDANCVLKLRLKSGLSGHVELSRTRNLRNTCVIAGDRGELEIGFTPQGIVSLRVGGYTVKGPTTRNGGSTPGVHACDKEQIESFAVAIGASTEPPVTPASARESVRLFDACQAVRQPLVLNWEAFGVPVDLTGLRGCQVLVLGGTGFLGSRLAEVLIRDAHARVRILVRDLSRLAGIARYPVEIVHGDANDRSTLERAMEGCEYVFNCTYGKGPKEEQVRVNIDAVETMLAAAEKCGVKRFVHTSTVSVYGGVRSGPLRESLPATARKSDVYGYTKLKGEEIVLAGGGRLARGAVVVQPTTIYGPGAPSWTLNPINLLKSGRVVLVNGGQGISNAVYVDDVVTALLQASLADAAAGERMLISGPDSVTWKEFFGAYSRMLGSQNLVEMTSEDIAGLREQQRKRQGNIAKLREILREEYQGNPRLIELPAVAAVRDVVRNVVPRGRIEGMKRQVLPKAEQPAASTSPQALPVHLPTKEQEAFFAATTRVDCAKAAAVMGYQPRVSLAEGMARVHQWATWANLLQ